MVIMESFSIVIRLRKVSPPRGAARSSNPSGHHVINWISMLLGTENRQKIVNKDLAFEASEILQILHLLLFITNQSCFTCM